MFVEIEKDIALCLLLFVAVVYVLSVIWTCFYFEGELAQLTGSCCCFGNNVTEINGAK